MRHTTWFWKLAVEQPQGAQAPEREETKIGTQLTLQWMDNFKPSSEIEDLKVLQTILKVFGPCNYCTLYEKTHSNFELSTASFCTTQIRVWVFPTKVIWFPEPNR